MILRVKGVSIPSSISQCKLRTRKKTICVSLIGLCFKLLHLEALFETSSFWDLPKKDGSKIAFNRRRKDTAEDSYLFVESQGFETNIRLLESKYALETLTGIVHNQGSQEDTQFD